MIGAWDALISSLEQIEEKVDAFHEVRVPDALDLAHMPNEQLEMVAERCARAAQVLHACQFLMLLQAEIQAR